MLHIAERKELPPPLAADEGECQQPVFATNGGDGEDEYAECLGKLEEAFQDILSSYSSDELAGRRLYQMTTSLAPITKKPS